MYINPFLAGILCTIVFEIVAVFLWGLFLGNRNNAEQEKDKHEDQ